VVGSLVLVDSYYGTMLKAGSQKGPGEASPAPMARTRTQVRFSRYEVALRNALSSKLHFAHLRRPDSLAALLRHSMALLDGGGVSGNHGCEVKLRRQVRSQVQLGNEGKSLDHAIAVNLCHLAKCALEKLAVRINVRAVQVTCSFPDDAPLVSGDAFLLERAILNLLENAIAFTPEGGMVAVSINHHERCWRLTVEDTGTGVPEYALPRVFERFYSLPRPDTGRKSSGLGLAFVKEVALLHGGAVELSNRPEGGARATMSLPDEI